MALDDGFFGVGGWDRAGDQMWSIFHPIRGAKVYFSVQILLNEMPQIFGERNMGAHKLLRVLKYWVNLFYF